jgi:KDO2-lipid IV(A) lauroyltransferase
VIDPKAFLADFGYASGWSVVRKMPEAAANRVFQEVADRAWRADGHGVQRMRGNYRQVVGPDVSADELDELVHQGMRSYMRYWCEAFRIPEWSPELVLKRMKFHNVDVLLDAVASGRPTVGVLTHSGNWDLVGLWFTQNYRPLTTVAERLKPESLFDRFVAYRESLGMEVIPLTGGIDVYPRLMDAGKEGRLLALLAERDLTARGIPVTFMGLPTKMPGGPGALAVDIGAMIVPVELWYEGADLHGVPHTPIEAPNHGTRSEKIAVVTQQMADVFTVAVRRHPADWHMLQRMWDDVPPLSRAAAKAASDRRG